MLLTPGVFAGAPPVPSESSTLILDRVRIRANTARRIDRQNGELKVDGTVNTNAPFDGLIDDIQSAGVAVRIVGAGAVDVTLAWTAGECTIRSSQRGPRVSCRAAADRARWKIELRPRRIPNLFDVRLRAKGFDLPALSLDRVAVIVSTVGLARQDDIGGCVLFGRQNHRLRCRESGVVPTGTATPTPTATPTSTFDPSIPLCGDGTIGAGEDCDDGGRCIGGSNDASSCESPTDCPGGVCRPVGGDGCAINCTVERSRVSVLSAAARATIQQATFPIQVALRGIMNLQTGKLRAVDALDPHGNVLTSAGSYPVTIRGNDIYFEPVRVTGLVCACPRFVDVPRFGAGNSGEGSIGCGTGGLTEISYRLVQDHNTTPGHAQNGNTGSMVGLQLPDDPECDDAFVFPSGLTSNACLESQDPLCSNPNASGQHPGVCNSPRSSTYFGGPASPGSALIHAGIAIGLLNDAGLCRTDLPPGSPLCPADYGPDCQPCTDDDADLGRVETIALTTGSASAAIYDAALQKGRTMDVVDPPVPCATSGDCEAGQVCIRQCNDSGQPCLSGNECGPTDTCLAPHCSWNGCGSGSFLSRCRTTAIGTGFDCAALAADQTPDNGDGDGLSGATLAASYPTVDALRLGDSVTTLTLELE
jgi:hypothetical protein